MAVLSYQTPAGSRPVLATVVLWLWAILDTCFGVLLAVIGSIILIYGRTDPQPMTEWGIMLWLIGVGLASWGVHTGSLSVQVYRMAADAPAKTLRACRWAMYGWSGLVLLVIGIILARYGRDGAGFCFSLSWIWFIFFGGMIFTYVVLKRTREKEIARLTQPNPNLTT